MKCQRQVCFTVRQNDSFQPLPFVNEEPSPSECDTTLPPYLFSSLTSPHFHTDLCFLPLPLTHLSRTSKILLCFADPEVINLSLSFSSSLLSIFASMTCLLFRISLNMSGTRDCFNTWKAIQDLQRRQRKNVGMPKFPECLII